MANPSEKRKPSLASKLLAEAIATFVITATATSVDILYYTGDHVDDVSRWLARGFAAAIVIYAFSETSGAHADPAVSIGFTLRRVFPLPMMLAYVAAQFAGGFAAAGLLAALFGVKTLTLGASHPGPHFTSPEAAACEVVLTFFLMLVVLMTSQELAVIGKQAALAVGFAVAVCGFAGGPISGASMNPARTLAPLLLAGAFGNVWVYVVGPLAGAALAVLAHALLCGPPNNVQREAATGR